MEKVYVNNCLAEEDVKQADVQQTALWHHYQHWLAQVAQVLSLARVVNYK